MYSTSLRATLSLLSLLPLTLGVPMVSRSMADSNESCGTQPAIYTITSQTPYLYGPQILPAGNTCNPNNQNCIPSTNVVEFANATIEKGSSDLNLTAISLLNITAPKPISTVRLPVAYNLNPVQAPNGFAVNVVVLTRYWNVTGTYQCSPDGPAMPFEVHFPLSDGVGLQTVNYPLPEAPGGGMLVIEDAMISFCSVDDHAGDAQGIGGCYLVQLNPTEVER